MMIFTFNIGVGITAGFVIYPLVKLFQGKIRDVRAGMWVLSAASVVFYIFYPYSQH